MREREVVVGMDGSVAAFRAMDAAVLEAERRAAVLEVVHCVADRDEAGPVLRAAAARLAERHPGLAVRQSEEAALRGDRLTVLHVWSYRPAFQSGPGSHPVEPVQDEIARQAMAANQVPVRVVAPLHESSPGRTVHTRAVRATPCQVLIQATETAELLVLAAHRGRARPGRELGPVAQALLRHAHCPVIIVPVPAP